MRLGGRYFYHRAGPNIMMTFGLADPNSHIFTGSIFHMTLDRSGRGSTTIAPSTGTLQGGGDKCTTGVRSRAGIGLHAEKTIIGIWNVCTLYACRKVKELTHELTRYQWDILGLAEVRWTGFEIQQQRKDTDCGTAERNPKTKMGLHSLLTRI